MKIVFLSLLTGAVMLKDLLSFRHTFTECWQFWLFEDGEILLPLLHRDREKRNC